MKQIDSFFKITERKSSLATEIRGGFVTFFAMAYITVLNPIVLGGADTQGNFLDPNHTGTVAAVTALVAGIMTIIMGLVANYPLALATGLGFNSVLAVCAATIGRATWADMMGLVVIEGAIILILVLTGFRKAVFKAIPAQIRIAIGVGIGLFIALVGVWDSGFITKGADTPTQIASSGSVSSVPDLIFIIVLFTIFILSYKRVKGAILIAIIGGTTASFVLEAIFHFGNFENGGWKSNIPAMTDQNVLTLPDLSLFGHFNLLGSFADVGAITAVLLIITLLLTNFFDAMGTMYAVANEAGDVLLDEDKNPIDAQKILAVDSVAAIAGGVGSISSNTAFVESSAGVADGARTGLSAIVTGILFLFSMFLSPLVSYVPAEATTPALVFVGFLMLMQVTDINWKDWEIAIPAFLTIIIMPFSYSISAGIGAGIIAFVIMKIAVGKARMVHPLLWVIAALFIFYFAEAPINALLQ